MKEKEGVPLTSAIRQAALKAIREFEAPSTIFDNGKKKRKHDRPVAASAVVCHLKKERNPYHWSEY